MNSGRRNLLSKEQRKKIKKLFEEEKLQYRILAKRFGVSDGTIKNVILGKYDQKGK